MFHEAEAINVLRTTSPLAKAQASLSASYHKDQTSHHVSPEMRGVYIISVAIVAMYHLRFRGPEAQVGKWRYGGTRLHYG